MQNRKSFPTLATVSLRYRASSRMTAALATAVLVDVGLVTQDDSSLVIDHHHIQRDRKKVMDRLRQDAVARHRNEAITCIYFDGRKNWTNVMEEEDRQDSRVKMGTLLSPMSQEESICFTSLLLKQGIRLKHLSKLPSNYLIGFKCTVWMKPWIKLEETQQMLILVVMEEHLLCWKRNLEES